ncbi:MAG TPA: ABC transporter permease [Terriglobales bacterium]|jgi:predicted permease|nr:ABC transporter permease [Terriglobales bacterium]
MNSLFQDLRYGSRMLFKSPAFTTVAVLTLALGIGANTAIFTVVNALLLKMLPLKAPQELVVVGNPGIVSSRWHGTPETDYFSYPLYREFRDNNTVFTGLAAAATEDRVEVNTSSAAGASEEVDARLVTGNYFPVLGVDAAAGRLLTESDETQENANPVAVLSYGYWERKFGFSAEIVGKEIRLNGYPFTIVGVAQPKFRGDVVGSDFSVFVPLTMQPKIMREEGIRNDPEVSWLSLIGRLKPRISVAQAKANVNLVFQQAVKGSFGARLKSDDLNEIAGKEIAVVAGGTGLSGFRADYSTPLLLLMGIVGLVLLIACVNVANLLLARARTRSKEIAVRLAIGASQRRLLQQLLTESILLAFLGGACGAVLAIWGVRLLVSLFGSDAEYLPLSPDLRLLFFTFGVSLLTGILFGLVPALNSLRVQVNPTLKNAGAATSETRWGFGWGKGLVAGQIALSLLVLFASTLLGRSLQKLVTQDLGFDSRHLIVAHPGASDAGYKGEGVKQLAQELTTRLASLPGVRGVSYSSLGLFSGGESSDKVIVPGFTGASREDYSVREDAVSTDYFTVLGIPVFLGRGIAQQDTAGSTRVAVINESMMKKFFHGENPVGRQFEIDDPEEKGKPLTVIGVCKDAKDHGEFLRNATPPRFYNAFQQFRDARHFVLEIATKGDPNLVLGEVRSQIKTVDSNLPIYSLYTVGQLVERNVSNRSVLATLSEFFAGLALVLACVGLYGIMSYTVAGRIREIGIRVALGAQRSDVLELVLREGMLLVLIGLGIGIPLSLAGGRILHSFLFGLKATDPVSLAIVIVLLGAVGAVAGFIPARRATKVDPIVALRYE